MNVMTVILTATITLLVCAAVVFCTLWISERKRRKKAEAFSRSLEGILQHAIGAEREARCAQEMVCQSTDSVAKSIEEAQRELYEHIRQGFAETGGAIEAGFRKLDEISAGGMDAEARRTLEADLNKLLSYSMDDAFKAAKGIGSDAE